VRSRPSCQKFERRNKLDDITSLQSAALTKEERKREVKFVPDYKTSRLY